MRQAPAFNEKKHKIIVRSLTPPSFSASLLRVFEKKSARLPKGFFIRFLGMGKSDRRRPLGKDDNRCGGASAVQFLVFDEVGSLPLLIFFDFWNIPTVLRRHDFSGFRTFMHAKFLGAFGHGQTGVKSFFVLD